MPAEKVTVAVENRILQLSNLDKVLWPDTGYTKSDLIQYYREIAPTLLPHLRNRPLTLTRCPDGIGETLFYQKNAPPHTPAWVRTYRAVGDDKVINYVLADEPATLVWLANQACIGIHPWLSSIESPAQPDQIVIDLDPNPPAGFEEARRIALVVREVLHKMELVGYPKLSGATGVHVYIPVEPIFPFSVAARFAGFIAQTVARLLPDEATNERTIRARGARVYVDYLQNVSGQTIAAPYSVRPRPGAPVSVPVTWDELTDCRPEDFDIKNVPERVRKVGDLFAAVLRNKQSIADWVDELALHPSPSDDSRI